MPCIVVAPSLIPQRPGDRVKTDRRDAVRPREDAKADHLRARHRLAKFLLRHDLHAPQGVKSWTVAHRRWLDGLKLNGMIDVVFREYLHAIDEIASRVTRLEAEIEVAATVGSHAPVIQALQALRGVQVVTAATLVAEVGQFSRFRRPSQLMAYAGLVPREHSSGVGRWQGGITKTGNAHLRRIACEAAWAYRHKPSLKGRLRNRQEEQDAQVREIAWHAQETLHKKYMRLIMRGKGDGVAAAAVASELLGFVWNIACTIEANQHATSAA